MKKKCRTLSLVFLALAVATYLVTYFVYHFVTPEGQITAYRSEIGKPMVTLLLGQLGTMFFFASILALSISWIVFSEENKKKRKQ